MSRHAPSRVLPVLVAALVLPLAALVPASAAPAPAAGTVAQAVTRAVAPPASGPAVRPAKPQFTACGRFRCAEVKAPLDYDRPAGPRVELAVLKVPARQPENRIGTLFVNPGGPGGSATDFATFAGRFLGPAVRNRFDIVGVDPRGVGGSEALVCRGQGDAAYPRSVYPRGPRQREIWLDFDRQERRLCADERIVDHMSTADTARDMDWVRRALGERRVTYFGASYGTFLGATYASMFPDSVRVAVVDGVLDPVEWTTGRDGTGTTVPVTARLGSDEGSREELASGLAACDDAGRPACPIAGDALDRFDAVADRLRTDPQTAREIDTTYDAYIGETLGMLYGGDLQTVARLVRRTERALAAHDARGARADARLQRATERLAAVRERARAVAARRPFPGPYGAAPSVVDRRTVVYGAFHGVLCSDSVNPDEIGAWDAAATEPGSPPDFRGLWTWSSSACKDWPGSSADAFRGPFEVPDPDRLLIVNNRHDPATPISGALALQDAFGSRLVVGAGYGHVATGSNTCATRAVSRYLITATPPMEDVSCRADAPLFPAP